MTNRQIATFGGGCFWCIEAVIQRLKGIEKVESGYSAGEELAPTYRSVCSGTSGHAEVVQVTFDADMISYEDLLIIFMTSHDPTTLNRQGADKGTQYRSIILFHDVEQKKIAEHVLETLKASFDESIMTQLEPLEKFYSAEIYHQNYYNNNTTAGYCRVVIDPKIKKLRDRYSGLLKEVTV